jgi:hypothetical protein
VKSEVNETAKERQVEVGGKENECVLPLRFLLYSVVSRRIGGRIDIL